MINICPKCHDYGWNKTVTGNTLRCPCGHTWTFRKAPVYIISGCSGVGKTTTAMDIMRRTPFVTLDADMFDTSDPHKGWVEALLALSRNINQSGATVVWTSAGCIDRLTSTYNARFFTDIRVLALTCETAELRRRMTEGRSITDEGWLTSSADYNEYFRTHDELGGIRFGTLDITALTPAEAAEKVIDWINQHQ